MEDNREMITGKKVKVPLSERIKGLFVKFIQIFEEYPFTIGAIILMAILCAIYIDNNFSENGDRFIQDVMAMLLIFSAGSLLIEEIARREISIAGKQIDRGLFKIIALGINGLFSFIIVWLMDTCSMLYRADEDMLWGIKAEYYEDIVARLLGFCIPVFIVLAVYGMYKRSGHSFKRYCIGVFGQVMKVSLLYFIFAIGIAIIYGIFDVLIFSLDYSLLGRLEIILLGAIYVPAIIKAFSAIKDEIGKFTKVVVLYALYVIMLAAFVIIYLYILRILIGGEMPSNEVFNILAWLFVLGAPTWTMAMNFDNEFLGKISRKIPYAFIPCVILQMVCMGMRISQYGITMNRYSGMVLIMFELVYLATYIIGQGKYVDRVVFAVPVLLFVTLWMPGINIRASVIYSQGARLEKLWADEGERTKEEESEIRKLYDEIYYSGGLLGEDYLNKHYTASELRTMKSYEYYYYSSYDDTVRRYYSWRYASAGMGTIDVSGYSAMTIARINSYDMEDYRIEVEAAKGQSVYYDMERYISKFKADEEEYFEYNNPVKLDDNTYLFVTYISYSEVDYEPNYMDIEGFIFYK